MDGRNVFMHTETLMQSDTPNQVIGIIAHETGHIAGAHPATLRNDLKTAQSQQLLLLLLGIGLAVGGAMSGGDTGREIGGLGQGVMMGGETMVIRSFLLKRRSQEAAADQAGFEYLTTTKQSGRGMLETFERLARNNLGSYGDPYMQSHPTEATRMRQLRDLVERSPYVNVRDTPEMQLRHDLVRAKLFGFTRSNAGDLSAIPGSQQQPARALCAGHRPQLHEPEFLQRQRDGRHRRADPRAARFALFLGAEGPGTADGRQAPRKPWLRCARSVELLKGKGPQVQIQLADAIFRSSEDPRSNDEVIQLIERAIIIREGGRQRLSHPGRGLLSQEDGGRGRSGAGGAEPARLQQQRGVQVRQARADAAEGRLSQMVESRRYCEHDQTEATELSRSATPADQETQ